MAVIHSGDYRNDETGSEESYDVLGIGGVIAPVPVSHTEDDMPDLVSSESELPLIAMAAQAPRRRRFRCMRDLRAAFKAGDIGAGAFHRECRRLRGRWAAEARRASLFNLEACNAEQEDKSVPYVVKGDNKTHSLEWDNETCHERLGNETRCAGWDNETHHEGWDMLLDTCYYGTLTFVGLWVMAAATLAMI